MFNDYYLKFTDATEAASIIGTQDITDEDGTVLDIVLHRDGCDLSVIGTMYAPTGNTLTDAEGNEYPETAPIAGYHVNARCRAEQLDLVAYDTKPATPQRIWA